MSPQDRSPITKTTTSTADDVTSTSVDTATIPPPKGPTYNPELAAALTKYLFDKKPTPTALNNHFFGKKHTLNAETMTSVNGEATQAYRSRIAQMNERLASKPAATRSTNNTVVGDAVAAPAWLPKSAMPKPRKSAIVPRGQHPFGKPKTVTFAPLPGLGQTINGEFVNTPGRYQGYSTRIPHASFVAEYTKPVGEVE